VLSVVVPAYNEEGNIAAFYEALSSVLSTLEMSWELIVVDDGSRDGTWSAVQQLNARDHRVRGVRLSRNFGHQHALFSGLSHATGDAVISMDADLQHPPNVVPALVNAWRQGSKVVHTVRIDDETLPLFKRMTSQLYYRVHSALGGIDIQTGMADFRLLDRQVLDELLQMSEEGLFLRGLVQWLGYPSARVVFQSHKRHSGSTKYTLRKMIKLGWSGITSFSLIPLRIGIFIGLITSVLAFGGICYAVLGFFFWTVVPGWASVVFIVSFLFGVLFILLGLIGEYIGRILVEVRHRPRYLVNEVVGLGEPLPDRTHWNTNPAPGAGVSFPSRGYQAQKARWRGADTP